MKCLLYYDIYLFHLMGALFFNLSWIQVLTIDLVDTIFQGWIFHSDVYISYALFFTVSGTFRIL